MHIGNKPSENTYYIKDSNKQINTITEVTTEKDLGVHFDPKLNFQEHVNKKVLLANRNLGLIAKTFSYMSKEMFLTLYKSIVRPHLEYITPVWSPQFKKEQKIIENVQRRATRMVKGLCEKPYHERLKFLGIPSLEYRRQRADMIQTYKIFQQIDKMNINALFPGPPNTSRTRGNSLKIHKQHCRTNLRKHSFSQRVVGLWNNLPQSVVNAPSINSFKNQLNKNWVGGPEKFKPKCLE